MNIELARKVVIVLLISGTLISSVAVTGQTFATTKEKPDIDIEDGIITKGGDEDEATDEGDNETGSARQTGGPGEFCLEGTGGTTGKPCIPCDPTKPTPGMGTNCPIISGGGEIMQKNVTKSKNAVKGEFTNPAILENLLSPDNPAGRAKIIFGNLESEGKVPPNTAKTIDSLLTGDTEESTKALGTLCDIASADKASMAGAIDCGMLGVSGDQSSNTTTVAISCNAVCQEVIKALIVWLVNEALEGTAPGIDDATKYCQQNPAACK